MTPAEVGPWILLALGALSIAAAVAGMFRDKPPANAWMAWVFGFALAGVGAYGPVFLSDYVQLLDAMKSWQSTGSEEGRERLLRKASQEGLSEDMRRAAIHFAAGDGSDEAAEALDKVIEETPADAPGHELLVEARQEIGAKQTLQRLGTERLADVARSQQAPPANVEPTMVPSPGASVSLNPSWRATASNLSPLQLRSDLESLRVLDDQQLLRLGLERRTLDQLSTDPAGVQPPPP